MVWMNSKTHLLIWKMILYGHTMRWLT